MADPRHAERRQSTTRRELITCVIEDPSPCRQRASCDLNQVLTLRGSRQLSSLKIDRPVGK
jgi:hypothetical protein